MLASIAFFVALGFGIVIPSIPIYAESFGVSAFAASAVISAFALMRFVSSPFAGAWTNRFGERNVLFGSDFPHAIADLAGTLARIGRLPPAVRDRVRGANAAELFGIDAGGPMARGARLR